MIEAVVASGIDDIINIILSNAHLPSGSSPSGGEDARGAYNSSFEGEGRRKVSFVLEDLKHLKATRGFDPSRAVVLSVGGSDGSDLRALLMNETKIKGGVLLEYDTAAADKARRNSTLADGRGFRVVTGDATQKLGEALEEAASFDGVNTLIVLCFGVLHELPTRSPGYAHDTFFTSLFNKLPSVLVYCAEPCAQAKALPGWPETVEIGFRSVIAGNLLCVSQLIREKRFRRSSISEPQLSTTPYVRMNNDLAVEVLHKVLRFDDVARFHHEMGEQLTSFDAPEVMGLVQGLVADVEPGLTYLTSDGFRESYKKYEVLARDTTGRPLPLPVTHSRLILRRCAWPQAPGGDSDPPPRDPEERLRALKAEIVRELKSSQPAMNALDAALGAAPDGDARSDSDESRAEKLLERLIATPFERTVECLLAAHDTAKVGKAHGAIVEVSRRLIPWLYVFSGDIDLNFLEHKELGRIIPLPVGLINFTEIIMAGFARRAADFEWSAGTTWPNSSPYHVSITPESGRADAVLDNVRADLTQRLDPEPTLTGKPLKFQDEMIIGLLEDLYETGSRICWVSDMPENEEDYKNARESMRLVADKYKPLVVSETDNALAKEQQRLFGKLLKLLRKVES